LFESHVNLNNLNLSASI